MASLRHLVRYAAPTELWRLALKTCQGENIARPLLTSVGDVKFDSTSVAERYVVLNKDNFQEGDLDLAPKNVESRTADLHANSQSDSQGSEAEVDYSYFKRIVKQTSRSEKSKGSVKIDPEVLEDHLDQHKHGALESKESEISEVTSQQPSEVLKQKPHLTKVSSRIKPRLPTKSASLAAYVNDSETLQKLVKMNIDLSEVEKNTEVANFLVKSDFESQVVPRFFLLKQLGIKDENLPSVVSKHPSVLIEDPDHMKVRVDYLLSKGFLSEDVGSIVTRNPVILTTPVKVLDAQLGFLQQLFHLQGQEVRTAITKLPKLAVSHKFFIQEGLMTFKEFLGYSAEETKHMLLTDPKLFLANRKTILDKHEYYRNTMGIGKHLIMTYPSALRTRISLVRQRHLFLKSIGRDQFDPKKPNYVSLQALTSGRDREFCKNVAKVPTTQFNSFLKTL